MRLNFISRREFFKYLSLSLLLFLNSCRNSFEKVKITFQDKFLPKPIKDTFPKNWVKTNLDFKNLSSKKYSQILKNSDFCIVNDGWLNKIQTDQFYNINSNYLLDKLDYRSKKYLNSFSANQKNKLFPIGVIPYAIVIKNNKDLINTASKSWDFLLKDNLKEKIILPNSPRLVISISDKIKETNSLRKLRKQVKLFDDKNSLNWLTNSDAIVAVVPYTLCRDFLKIDSRLSIVFPNNGTPLIWQFLLLKSELRKGNLVDWVDSLESPEVIDKLSANGWYLPFKNQYNQEKYFLNNKYTSSRDLKPSKDCWLNSWSFKPLEEKEKIRLENIWNISLSP